MDLFKENRMCIDDRLVRLNAKGRSNSSIRYHLLSGDVE